MHAVVNATGTASTGQQQQHQALMRSPLQVGMSGGRARSWSQPSRGQTWTQGLPTRTMVMAGPGCTSTSLNSRLQASYSSGMTSKSA